MADDHDASDALQNASIKAFRAFGRFSGGQAKPWFLAIVRNECMSSLRRRNRVRASEWSLEEDQDEGTMESPSPEGALLRQFDVQAIQAAIDALPPPHREVILLRELEDLSYGQIAEVTGVPLGTVMSRLARARTALREALR